MKTVQECLRELDTEELIDAYLAKETLHKEMVVAMKTRDNIIARDLWLKYRDKIREYIEYLRDVSIEPAEEPAVLYVYEGVSLTLWHERYHGLVHISELEEKGVEAEDYSYVLCPHAQVAGFLVADTKRTQENLLNLMTDVLYEASFFGYTKEDQDEAIREMEEVENEIETEEEDGEADESVKDGEPEEDILDKPEAKRTEREEKAEEETALEKEYWKASNAYGEYLRKKALREVFASVCCGGAGSISVRKENLT